MGVATYHSVSHLLANPRPSASTEQDLSLEDVRFEHRLGVGVSSADRRWSHGRVKFALLMGYFVGGRWQKTSGGGESCPSKDDRISPLLIEVTTRLQSDQCLNQMSPVPPRYQMLPL